MQLPWHVRRTEKKDGPSHSTEDFNSFEGETLDILFIVWCNTSDVQLVLIPHMNKDTKGDSDPQTSYFKGRQQEALEVLSKLS